METEEKLCIKVLRTLQQMLVKRNRYGERVSTAVPWHIPSPAPVCATPAGSARRAAACGCSALFHSSAGLGWGLVTFICLGRATCCGKCC